MRIRSRIAIAVLTGALALAGVACSGDDAGDTDGVGTEPGAGAGGLGATTPAGGLVPTATGT